MSAEITLNDGQKIGDNWPCYVVAEIGQNHQGEVNIAKEMIVKAKMCGANCVKFQKTDLKSRFTKDALNKKYDSINSWGPTYGEHRKHLEFSENEMTELFQFAKNQGIACSATGMDIPSVDFVNSLNPPFLKVGSGDANNIPLLKHIAQKNKPIFLSTGMQNMETVRYVYKTISSVNCSLCVLHCVSAYPAPVESINLKVIQTYKTTFPEAVIGYSGHEEGIEISLAACCLGAKVIERHFTLDKTWKGSDHKASLDPTELMSLVEGIRKIEKAFGEPEKKFQLCETPCFEKLGKTVVASRNLKSGMVLDENMLDVKVANSHGWPPSDFDRLIAKRARVDIMEDEVISADKIK